MDRGLIRAARRIIKRAVKDDAIFTLLSACRAQTSVEHKPPKDFPSPPSGDMGQSLDLSVDEDVEDIESLQFEADVAEEGDKPKGPVQPITVFDELKLGELDDASAEGMSSKSMPVMLHTLPEDLRKTVPAEWAPPNFSGVDEQHPLIPPHADVHIYWCGDESTLHYDVVEPPLTKEEHEILDRIKSVLLDLIEVSSYDISKRGDPGKYMREKFDEIVDDYGFRFGANQREKLAYYIIRDFVGLERIEPLMRDPNLEDLSCIGPGIPIYVYHRKYGSLKTNITFPSSDELNRFIVKLAQICGRHVSVANPLLEGALPDGSRVQATYAVTKDISTRGSTFTIRKFTKDPLTITDMVSFGTVPPLLAAYLWMAIEYRQSVLISGGTASGKTSLLNALSLFIPPEAKVVSIEDTPELRLPHENWIQKIGREISGEGGSVTMFDLLKAALRERPDYIMVGEVRGKEAYILFQGMATGHPGMATIHAEDLDTLVDRLTTPPISLSPALLHALDVIIFAGRARVGSIDVRRAKGIHEVINIDLKSGRPITNRLAQWIPGDDCFEFVSDKSYVMDKIIRERGVSPDSVWGELRRRAFVLKWMKDNNVRYYRDVGRIIKRYYKEPKKLLEELGYAEAGNADRI